MQHLSLEEVFSVLWCSEGYWLTQRRISRRTAAVLCDRRLLFSDVGWLLAATCNYLAADGKETHTHAALWWKGVWMQWLAFSKKTQGDVTWHFTYEYKFIYWPRKQRQYTLWSRRQAKGYLIFDFYVMKNYSTSNIYFLNLFKKCFNTVMMTTGKSVLWTSTLYK